MTEASGGRPGSGVTATRATGARGGGTLTAEASGRAATGANGANGSGGTGPPAARAAAAHGGDLNAFSAKEYTCYYCRVLGRDLPMAVEFMVDMIQGSVIARSDVEAERQVILEEIHMHEDDPGDLIHDLFAETLWQGHPLGRPVLGTKETIAAVSRDQVRGFYRRHYRLP